MDALFDFTGNKKTCKKKAVFPVDKLKNRGFTVISMNGGFKLKANRRVTAKLVNYDGKDYIKKVLSECYDKECELMTESESPIWDIERLSDSTFMIRKV